MERKLAAILSADVCGYSRLVEDDDEATIRSLQHHHAMMRTEIEDQHGRVVDSPGDNLLAEFPSVVDAVRCAINMQEALRALNAATAVGRRMDFRMGITVGDVVVEDEKLYGNGVNIAARLESLAEPGGICLSGNAHEQVEGKLELDMRYDGEQMVKNITKPISVWRISLSDNDMRAADGALASPPTKRLKWSAWWQWMVGSLIVMAAIVLLMRGYHATNSSTGAASSGAEMTASARPAVLVLPFSNLSNDAEQDYFVNGIAEDITTDLSKLDGLYVVSTNAAVKLKGADVDYRALRDEFGVSHAVEGSVRKIADHVRISVRLIDVNGGKHLWSERYDFGLSEIFAIQDEVRGKILTALRVNLSSLEQRRFERAPTDNLEAYDYYLRGLDALRRAREHQKPELRNEAIGLFERAIEIDPKYAMAHATIGITKYLQWFYDGKSDQGNGVGLFAPHYEKAAALAPNDARIKSLVLRTRVFEGDYDGASALAEDMASNYPKNPDLLFDAGTTMITIGSYERALELLERAAALYPKRPPYSYAMYGIALHMLGRSGEARDLLREATLRSPQFLGNHLILTIVYDALDEADDAKAQAKHIVRISPEFRAQSINRIFSLKDKSVVENYVAALRRAGLP